MAKIDPEDPTYAPQAKRAPSTQYEEVWRTDPESQKFSGKHWVRIPKLCDQLVYPHEVMRCECPVHGQTFMVYVSKDNSMLGYVDMRCGCKWYNGGRVMGGNSCAGFFRREDAKPIAKDPVSRAAVKVTVARVPSSGEKPGARVLPQKTARPGRQLFSG